MKTFSFKFENSISNRIFAPQITFCSILNVLAMPKQKTNSGAKKRFKITGTGKIKRKHAFHSHILTKKSNKRKRNLVSATLVSSADTNRIEGLLCM